jgi:cyanophycinase
MRTFPMRLTAAAWAWRAILLGLVLLLECGSARSGELIPPARPEPAAGSLVLVGGGDLPDAAAVRFLELAGGKNARLVVIPTATELADTPERLPCRAHWLARGAAAVVLLHTRSRQQADDPAFVKPLTEATGVWFSGGDQSRLVDPYHGTLVERELHQLLARGGVIGGTSAGAAVMSPVMIVGGSRRAEVGTGFGFLPGYVVDTHFGNRQRLDRLLGVLARHPNDTGLGIDEDTAVVVTGQTLTVLGSGAVRVCTPVGDGPAHVQVLKAGDRFAQPALAQAHSPAVAAAPVAP